MTPEVDLLNLEDIRREMSSRKPLEFVYHGTRCPMGLIMEDGLRYDKEYLEKKVRDFCRYFNVNFRSWSNSTKYSPSGQSVMNELLGLGSKKYRCQIWVSEDFENAASYSRRNPEILWMAIDSILKFKNPRRSSKKWQKYVEDMKDNLLSRIGPRKVVTIDAQHPSIQVKYGNNALTKEGSVPPEAIIGVQFVVISE